MRINAINNNIYLNTSFTAKIEQSEELDLITSQASEKDLAEFSLVLDEVNNASDRKSYYVRQKKKTYTNPEKGFDIWEQQNWDSFPKKYKTILVESFEEGKLSGVLKQITDSLKITYNIKFDKPQLQKQISKKLAK